MTSLFPETVEQWETEEMQGSVLHQKWTYMPDGDVSKPYSLTIDRDEPSAAADPTDKINDVTDLDGFFLELKGPEGVARHKRIDGLGEFPDPEENQHRADQAVRRVANEFLGEVLRSIQ